ncbi:MAG TPA: adenylate kinase [Gemmatimonadaceae bacterium]|nr:adenylate kinase [Gemmatimonadaceae bacterium]
MIAVLLGPPGCGKGTQGEKLAAALGIPKISTGDVIRAAMKDGTPLGVQAKAFYDRGDLVPDALIMEIIRDTLAAPEQARGAILDGVVRTVPQAEGLAGVLKGLGRTLDLVLLFQIADDVLVARLSGRTVCEACGTPFTGRQPGELHADCKKEPRGHLVRRKDDEPDAVRNRLKVYQAQTAPVIDWYRTHGGPLTPIEAEGSMDEVGARVRQAAGIG